MGGQQSSQWGADSSGRVPIRYIQAWQPFLNAFGGNLTPNLSAGLQQLGSSTNPRDFVRIEELVQAMKLSQTQLAQLGQVIEQGAGRAAIAPILQTGVTAEDLLITLNMLLDDLASGESMGDEDSTLEGINADSLQNLQEALDQLVESLGAEGGGRKIEPDQLLQVFSKTIPLFQLAALTQRLGSAIVEQGMNDDGTNVGTTTPAPAASSTSTSSTAASKTPVRKASSTSSSKSGGMGGGGGLDLSISGFSIKPPASSGPSSMKK